MNREEYLAKRKELLTEAKTLANEGKVKEFEAKEKEILALDEKFEADAKAKANKEAMQAKLKDLNVEDLENNLEGGKVMDNVKVNTKVKEAEARGKALKANNAVQLTSTGILVPTYQSSEIVGTFNTVSSLLDAVKTIPRMGGESFEQSYVTGYGLAGESADNADYNETDVTFGFAEMNKSKITAYSELDEGVLKLPAADYAAEAEAGIRIALRGRITQQILVGNGAANRLNGIFSSTATAIDAETDLEIATITEDTLDELIYSYGGEENVEGSAALILSKQDLKALAQLRSAQGNKIHNIVTNGNVGTIDGIPFIINSACKALSASGTVAGDYSMAYGHLSNYGLAVFSDIDLKRSDDFKFRSGQIAHRGSVYLAGNVVKKNGFVRVKKGA